MRPEGFEVRRVDLDALAPDKVGKTVLFVQLLEAPPGCGCVSGTLNGPMGILADRFNRRVMVTIGGLIASCAVLSLGWADTSEVLLRVPTPGRMGRRQLLCSTAPFRAAPSVLIDDREVASVSRPPAPIVIRSSSLEVKGSASGLPGPSRSNRR